MHSNLNQVLIVSTILLLAPHLAYTKKVEEKKCVTEQGGAAGENHQMFRFVGSPLEQWSWFSPVLLDQFWHTSPFATPTYKLHADENNFDLTYHIEGLFDTDEVDIELSPDGKLLHIKGEKSEEDKVHKTVTKFHHSFALDHKVDAENIKAHVDTGGNLIVNVPRKEIPKYSCTKIPISTPSQGKTIK